MTTWETIFFQMADDYGWFSKNTFREFRFVCKSWSRIIAAECVEVGQMIDAKVLTEMLEYDKGIYDNTTYRKRTILKELNDYWDDYSGDFIPELQWFEDDLFDDDETLGIGMGPLPKKFMTFLDVYRKYPTGKVRIYQPSVIRDISDRQAGMSRQVLVNNMNNLAKLVHIHPLCYSKHYKSTISDTQFINVLCYVNILDDELNENLGDYDERYYIITLELDDLQDKKLHHDTLYENVMALTDRIVGDIGYLEDLDIRTFEEYYKLLVKRQLFNI